MITLSAAQETALAKRHVERRLFIRVDALDPDTGADSPAAFWNDLGEITVDGRVYTGSGPIIQVQTLSSSLEMSIPGLRVVLSGLSTDVTDMIRGDTVGQRPLEVDMGIFDISNSTLIEPLIPRFVGVVDEIEIITPESGGDGKIVLTCESTSRALTISRTGTRSSPTQHERDPNDDIYKYTNLQKERPVYFGRRSPREISRGHLDQQ